MYTKIRKIRTTRQTRERRPEKLTLKDKLTLGVQLFVGLAGFFIAFMLSENQSNLEKQISEASRREVFAKLVIEMADGANQATAAGASGPPAGAAGTASTSKTILAMVGISQLGKVSVKPLVHTVITESGNLQDRALETLKKIKLFHQDNDSIQRFLRTESSKLIFGEESPIENIVELDQLIKIIDELNIGDILFGEYSDVKSIEWLIPFMPVTRYVDG